MKADAWDVTRAADRLYAKFGTGGRPAFRGVERIEGIGYVASWEDGSLAVATFVNGHIVAWRALASPDYDVLFGKTVSRETMPDAPHD